jgi:hypothetical protein
MAKRQTLGNPYAIAAASTAINNPAIVKGAGTIFKVAGIGLLGYFGYKWLKSFQQKQLMQEVISNPNSKAAIDIYYAIPAGLKKGDGSLFNPLGFITDIMNTIKTIWQKTDTARLMTVAVNIKNFDQTASAFQKLYGEPLYPLLQSVLSESELQSFVNKSTSNGTVNRTSVKLRDLVFSRTKVHLRSSPDATYSGGLTDVMDIGKNNILSTSGIGDFLGWVLSGAEYDSKNNVWFIQVGFKVMTATQLKSAGITTVPVWVKNAMGKSYTRWVSASTDLVDIFSYYNAASSKYPAGYSTQRYLLPIK